MASLANQTISSTYDGLIKTSSDNAVGVSGVTLLEDGAGNSLALSVGRANNGVTVTGNLAVDTNTLYVDAANNRVGIGISSPSANLHIQGRSDVADITMRISDTDGSAVAGQDHSNIEYYTTDGAAVSAEVKTIYADALGGLNYTISTRAGGGSLTERMRITSAGNLLINTDINYANIVGIDQAGNYDGTSDSAGIRIFSTAGTGNSGDYHGAIQFAKGTGSAAISAVQDASDADVLGLAFFTHPSTSGTAASEEKMRIDSSGNVGIGTSSPATGIEVATSSYTYSGTNYDIYGYFGASGGGVRIGQDSSTQDAVIGTVGANDMLFVTYNGSSWGERMRIDSSGDVNIGTTSGNGQLNIGSSAASAVRHAEFSNSQLGSSFSAGSYITLGRSDISRSMDVGIYGNGSNEFDGKILVNETGGSLILGTGGTERMRITSGGNVGIGRTPNTTLDVAGTLRVSPSGVPSVQIYRDVNLGNNASSGALVFGGRDTVDYAAGAGVESVTAGTWSSTSHPTDLYFTTTASGSATRTERMRITSGGLVNIGDAASTGVGRVNISANPSNNYQIEFFTSAGTSVGSITTSGGTTTNYNTSSDYRLKEDLQPIATPLDRVDLLNPVNFAWKTDGSRVDGFIAHELAEVVPEAVTGEKDAVDEEGNPIYQGIDQSKIVPLLVGAIKELRAEIELLKAQLQ